MKARFKVIRSIGESIIVNAERDKDMRMSLSIEESREIEEETIMTYHDDLPFHNNAILIAFASQEFARINRRLHEKYDQRRDERAEMSARD